ncbi:MAG: ROK family protein [Pseudomonadota bacterium]
MPRLGVDLGGTKIEAILISDDGRIVRRERVPTPKGDYRATLDAVAAIVGEISDDPEIPIGIGTPGSISPLNGLVRNANSTVLNGKPLDQDLAETLGRRVRIANDADCFALAEARAGAGVKARSVFGAILGTGVGGGLVIDGKLLSGPNRIAGEWGHNPLRPDVPTNKMPSCFCGRTGCVEAWCSGPALERSYRDETGRTLTVEEIVLRRDEGCGAAARLFDRHAEHLAMALAAVVNIADPELIVLGGGLSNLDHLYRILPERLPRYVFSDVFATPVVRNDLGDSAGVIGAAWLWPETSKVSRKGET